MNVAKGFSLVELIVSISIMGFIMGVVLYDMPKFNRNIIMNQAARQIAATLRDAEQRSVAVVQNSGVAAQNYGVYFDSTSGGASDFILFSDCNNNLKYEVAGNCGDESVKKYSFTQGVHIKSLKQPDDTTLNQMHVLFYRPDPSIKISNIDINGNGNCIAGCGAGSYGPFKITIESRDASLTKTVDVWLTGQISIAP